MGTLKSSLAVIWHQGLMKRNDEDITSAYLKVVNKVDQEGCSRHLVLWCDNCSGQNKNWTLFTAFAVLMGSSEPVNLETH